MLTAPDGYFWWVVVSKDTIAAGRKEINPCFREKTGVGLIN
jgi:hypothetical protein